MSERLNNAALISSHVLGLTSHASFFIQLKDLASIIGSVAKSIVLLKHKWVLLVPKHLLY